MCLEPAEIIWSGGKKPTLEQLKRALNNDEAAAKKVLEMLNQVETEWHHQHKMEVEVPSAIL